ncbi:MAG: hypothetical protein ACJ739_01895 [Acidimicrobiales bacterium]
MRSSTLERVETGWLDDTPFDDNVIRQFVRNQGDLCVVQAQASGGRGGEAPGVVLSDAGADLLYWNQAVLQRPLAHDGDELLDCIDDFWAGEGARPSTLLSVWPTPDLSARGWQLVGHPMLVVRAPGAHPTASKPGVRIERVTTPEQMGLVERTVIDGYPMPELAGRPTGAVMPSALLDTDVVVRLGYVDDEPAAATLGFSGRGVVNLCLAATLPNARRRGVWAAMVWARVDDAPDLPAVAYTSDHSRPGFVRMGFLPVTRCTLWARGG